MEKPFRIKPEQVQVLREQLETMSSGTVEDNERRQDPITPQGATADSDALPTRLTERIKRSAPSSVPSLGATSTDAPDPWFENRKETPSAASMTAAEAVLDEQLRAELEKLVTDQNVIQTAISRLESVQALPDELRAEVATKMQETKSALEAATETQAANWLDEVMRAYDYGEALGPLAAAGNPLARSIMVSLAAAVYAEQAAAASTGSPKTAKPEHISSWQAPAALGGAWALAITATYLSWAVTRPDKYVVDHAVPLRDSIAAALTSVNTELADYVATMSPSAIASIEAGLISAGISGVILAGRSQNFSRMHPSMKAAFLSALIASAGLGVLKMSTSIKDSDDIRTLGIQLAQELSGMKNSIEQLGTRLERLPDRVDPKTGTVTPGALRVIAEKKLNGEVNDPSKPGYGKNAATIEYLFTGKFDNDRFEAFMDGEGRSGSTPWGAEQRTRYAEVRDTNIAAIDRLKEEHQIGENILGLVARYANGLDLKNPLRLYDQANATAEAQGKTTALGHFLSNFNPGESVTTESMRILKEDTIGAFIRLLRNYERVTKEEIPKLKSFAVAVKQETGVDINDFVAQLQAEFRPLPVTVEQLQQMLASGDASELNGAWSGNFMESIFVRDVVDLAMPSAEVLRAYKTSLEKADIAFPDMEQQVHWYYLLIGILAALYASFDLAPAPIERAARRKNERLMREKLPEGLEHINDLEADITEQIVSRSHVALRLFEQALAGTDSPVTKQMPRAVSELHVRSELRRILGKGLPGVDSEVERRFRRRTLDVTHHVDMYHTYAKRLTELQQRLETEPDAVTAELLRELYPTIDGAIQALNQVHTEDLGTTSYQSAVTELERTFGQVRLEQLRAQATTIQAIINNLHATENALQTRMGADESIDARTLAQQTTIRFDTAPTSSRSFSVPRDVQLEAYALTQVKSNAAALTETLNQIQSLGIEIESLTTNDQITSPAFLTNTDQPDFSYDQAALNQLARTSIDDVLGTPDITAANIEGTIYDFERFDEYMREVNEKLAELRRSVLDTVDVFSELTPVFEWRLDQVSKRFTIFLELRTENEYGATAAQLVFPGNIPDFEKTPSAIKIELERWMSGSPKFVNALIAQVENFEQHAAYDTLLAKLTQAQQGSAEVVLAKNGRIITVDSESRQLLQNIYNISAVLKDQHPLMPMVRQGEAIEPTKLLHFTDPESVLSPHGNVSITGVFDDIIATVERKGLDKDFEIIYDAATEKIEVYRAEKNKKASRADQVKVLSTSIDHYSRRELARILTPSQETGVSAL